MKSNTLVLIAALLLPACSATKHSSSSKLTDSNSSPGAFDSSAALFAAGVLPDWNEIAFTHFSVGVATFSSSPDVATDFSGFFYLVPNTTTLYFDGVFYSGAVVNWTLSNYVNKITPIINAGNLIPFETVDDNTAYAAGYVNLVRSYFRTSTDNQGDRWLVQSRTCIATGGCNLPESPGNNRHFNQNEIFSYTIYKLAPATPVVSHEAL